MERRSGSASVSGCRTSRGQWSGRSNREKETHLTASGPSFDVSVYTPRGIGKVGTIEQEDMASVDQDRAWATTSELSERKQLGAPVLRGLMTSDDGGSYSPIKGVKRSWMRPC